ncbi:hypothetical protein CPB83DRAFT_792861 [Crepidotus variabilis]|uniref:Uncharacterized protein n=1 Tax=Crepidotus variabilis TaxID=179855 RepID=A0A9P6EEL6_9AGAR|nr:hypothetical protein CPB83DRAFT_792861 [Crepidotus variabilis]
MASTTLLPNATWHGLPNELRLAIVDGLKADDVASLSKVDMTSYQATVPVRFRKIRLENYEALERFLENVPRSYFAYIEDLFLCTKSETVFRLPVLPRVRADSVIALLSATRGLVKLELQVQGSLDHSALSPFPFLNNLKSLSISNCGDECRTPLSERFVVSMAASARYLEELSLDRINRSKLHAPELEGTYPCPPLAINDDNIPDHPILGSELCLPSLLRLPTLRKLTIRETHLGHEGWSTVPLACRLEVLDLGSCYHANDDFNTEWTERIMTAVGTTVDEFSLTSTVSDTVFAKPSVTPLQRLRKLHITPHFPVDSVVETVSNLAGSPVERISVQCFEEDVVDYCTALEEFLTVRVERGPQFFDKLKQIDVAVTASEDAPTDEETEERCTAVKRLQDICRDLRLASAFDKFDKFVAYNASKAQAASGPVSYATSFTDSRRFPVKARSMSI